MNGWKSCKNDSYIYIYTYYLQLLKFRTEHLQSCAVLKWTCDFNKAGYCIQWIRDGEITALLAEERVPSPLCLL